MKYRFLVPIASLLLFAASSEAAIFANFDGLANGAPLVPGSVMSPGYDSWSQSEGNPADVSPIAYGQAITTTGGPINGVAVGGFYATPVADSFSIMHTVDLPIAGSSTSATFTIGRGESMDIIQNAFEIGAYNGNNNLFSLVLKGNINNPNIWNLYYRPFGGSDIELSNSFALDLDQVTAMTLAFTANGSNLDFDLTLTNNATALNFNSLGNGANGNFAQIQGQGAANYDSFQVAMLKVPGSDPVGAPFDAYGTNFVALTEIQAVPEPSSLLLSGIATTACFLGRRRRI